MTTVDLAEYLVEKFPEYVSEFWTDEDEEDYQTSVAWRERGERIRNGTASLLDRIVVGANETLYSTGILRGLVGTTGDGVADANVCIPLYQPRGA